MRTILEITYKDGSVQEIELKPCEYSNLSWGITAVGCVFTTNEGEYMIIHPKSVTKMKQFLRE